MKTENGQKSTIGRAKQGHEKKRELSIIHFFLKIKVLFSIALKDKLKQFGMKSFSAVLETSTSL